MTNIKAFSTDRNCLSLAYDTNNEGWNTLKTCLGIRDPSCKRSKIILSCIMRNVMSPSTFREVAWNRKRDISQGYNVCILHNLSFHWTKFSLGTESDISFGCEFASDHPKVEGPPLLVIKISFQGHQASHTLWLMKMKYWRHSQKSGINEYLHRYSVWVRWKPTRWLTLFLFSESKPTGVPCKHCINCATS